MTITIWLSEDNINEVIGLIVHCFWVIIVKARLNDIPHAQVTMQVHWVGTEDVVLNHFCHQLVFLIVSFQKLSQVGIVVSEW